MNNNWVEEGSEHSQRFHFNSKAVNRVVSFVRDEILIVVNLKSILSLVGDLILIAVK